MTLYELGDQRPCVHPEAWVAAEATVIGQVTLEAEASVWPGAVLRGDIEAIRVGARSSVQDGCVLHTSYGASPTVIGQDVVVGHSVTLHSCAIEDEALIGIGATLLDGVRVGHGAWVAAGAVVAPGTMVPPGTLFRGQPAREVRPVRSAEHAARAAIVGRYLALLARYRTELKPVA